MISDVIDFNLNVLSKIELPDYIFSLDVSSNNYLNFISMHYARSKKASFLKTAMTKNVSQVSGTKKKPYKQKHTGRARFGSLRTIIHRGGGVAFGPVNVQQFIKLPKSECSLAKRYLLSTHMFKKTLFIFSAFETSSSKTKDFISSLKSFYKKSEKILFLSDFFDSTLLLASRNIKNNISFVTLNMLTANDIMISDKVFIDSKVIKNLSSYFSL